MSEAGGGRGDSALVIGQPVSHSLSPALFRAAIDACGLRLAYEAREVPPEALSDVMEFARGSLVGLSVTMPHKEAAAELCDELSPLAAVLGAANCVQVVRDGSTDGSLGRLVGHNTDGAGFVRWLSLDAGIDLDADGCRATVLGAGGAGRAVAAALTEAGAMVTVVNRTPERAHETAAVANFLNSHDYEARSNRPKPLAQESSEAGDHADAVWDVGWELYHLPAGCDIGGDCQVAEGHDEARAAIAASNVIVNATPLGMGGVGLGATGDGPPRAVVEGADSALPLDIELVTPEHLVVDLIYHPPVTPLLAAAQERGARTANGVGMLTHQAAEQFKIWTGLEPPIDAMRGAVQQHH